jgi:hypothetical protein
MPWFGSRRPLRFGGISDGMPEARPDAGHDGDCP